MATFTFRPGVEVELDEEIHTVLRQLPDDAWQFEHRDTGRIRTIAHPELLKMVEERRCLVPHRIGQRQTVARAIPSSRRTGPIMLDTLSEEELQTTKIRYAYVKAVQAAALTVYTQQSLSPVIAAVWNKLKKPNKLPHWSTVRRWFKQFTAHGHDARSLVTKSRTKGNRSARYNADYLDVIDQAISRTYLTSDRETIDDALNCAIESVAQENKLLPEECQHPLPTYSLVRARIASMEAFDVCAARHGRDAAKRKFRSALGTHVAEGALDIVEIDHTTFDVMVVDEKTLLPLGRPTLTLCVDKASRCILGYYLGFEPPGFAAVAQCLKHAFLPKTYLAQKYPDIKGSWEPFGVPNTIVVDNGLEFCGNNFEAVCMSFGISVQYSPRKKPWFKPHIERLIGSANRGAAHGLPGTTFANIFEREDYDAAKNAVLPLSTLDHILNIWIVDVHHERIHRTLKTTPIAVWREKISATSIPPLPTDVNELEAMLGQQDERRLAHDGLTIDYIRYNSLDLGKLRKRLGSVINDISVRSNPLDLGYVFVVDPQSHEHLRVPAVNFEYASGISYWQHKIFRRYAQHVLNRRSIEAIAEAKGRIRALARDALSNKKMANRKKAARLVGTAQSMTTSNQNAQQSPSPEIVMTHEPEQLNLLDTGVPNENEATPAYKPMLLDVESTDETLADNAVGNMNNE